jgi:hypothetical protein
VATGTVAIHLDDTTTDEELRNLVSWLQDEDELRGHVKVTSPPPRRDEMGGVADTIVVVLTSGTASALVTSLFSWLSHRRDVRRVNVTVGEVAVECGSPDDAERLLLACRDLLAGSE